MNKDQVFRVLRERNGYPIYVNEKIIMGFIDIITECLVNGEPVLLSGFGVFDVRVSNPRQGTNPRTLEKLNIGYYARPSFRAGRALKSAIRNSDLAAIKVREAQEKKAVSTQSKKTRVIE